MLARLVSGEDGFARTTLDVPVAWKGEGSSWVWARVETPGYTRRTLRHAVPLRSDAKTDVTVYPGGTLFGRVLDQAGEPVPRARVWLFQEEDGAIPYQHATKTVTSGGFAIDHASAGTYRIHARVTNRGSGRSDALELDPLAEPDPVEVRIGGGVTLTGRLLDPTVTAVAGARILAVPSGHEPAPSAEACILGENGGGVLGGLAAADGEGRFTLPALVPGAYVLYARWTEYDDPLRIKERALGERLGSVTVAAGADPVDLVSRQHRISVSVREHGGAPVDVLTFDEDGEVESTKLLLQRLKDGRIDEGFFWSHPTLVGERIVYAVEPDHDYVLIWSDPAVPYVEERVEVPRGRFHVPVDLSLGARRADAMLAVRVLDPAGMPFELGQGPRFQVFSTTSGRRIMRSVVPGLPAYNTAQGASWRTALPPGRYRVVADSEPLMGCVISFPLPRAPHLPVETIVEITAGQTSDIVLQLRAAGHLDLEASEPDALPGAEALQSITGLEAYQNPGAARARFGGGVAVLVSASGQRVEGLAFEVPGSYSLGLEWIAPGWPARCLTPLPVGTWTLRVENGGRVLAEREITIEAGKVTTIRW